uniref:Secreted protein n=1 Tax=Heterorhabditis bacteriophora TaxID=37862 RepID=A0A1I7WI29_HETBA
MVGVFLFIFETFRVTLPMNRARRCIKMDQAGFWFQSCCKKKTFAVCEKPAAYEVSFDKTTVEQNNFRRVKFFRHILKCASLTAFNPLVFTAVSVLTPATTQICSRLYV